MEHYYIKSYTSTLSNKANYLIVLNKGETGYMVRIVRDFDGYEDIREEFMAIELFETCIRTGYLTKIEGMNEKVAAIA